MRSEEDIRLQLRKARAMARRFSHQYDKGYADALAWVLEERAGRYDERQREEEIGAEGE